MPPQPLCIIGPLSQVWALLLFGCKFSACNQMHICMQQYTHPLPGNQHESPHPSLLHHSAFCIIFCKTCEKLVKTAKFQLAAEKYAALLIKGKTPKEKSEQNLTVIQDPSLGVPTHTHRETHTLYRYRMASIVERPLNVAAATAAVRGRWAHQVN